MMQGLSQHFAQHIVSNLNIGAKINQSDLERWVRAIRRVDAQATRIIGDEMQRQCAIRLSQRLYVAIATGKYSYPEYSPRYKKWKNRYFPGRKFWELKGDLMRAIQAFRGNEGWAAGVPDGFMDSGGKSWFGSGDYGPSKEISMYGAVNEYGPKKRPLFDPETKSFAKNEWKIIGSQSLRQVGKAWR